MPCGKCHCAKCKPCVLPVPDAIGPYVACVIGPDGKAKVRSGATAVDALHRLEGILWSTPMDGSDA